MRVDQVGGLFHRKLGHVEIDRVCISLQAENLDGSTAFVVHEGEVKQVSRDQLLDVDSPEAIADEMKGMLWRRVEPPLWWPAIQDHVIADGALGTLRAHMVRGHVEPGRIVANAHVIGQSDWPEACYSDIRSHLSQ